MVSVLCIPVLTEPPQFLHLSHHRHSGYGVCSVYICTDRSPSVPSPISSLSFWVWCLFCVFMYSLSPLIFVIYLITVLLGMLSVLCILVLRKLPDIYNDSCVLFWVWHVLFCGHWYSENFLTCITAVIKGVLFWVWHVFCAYWY